MDVYGCVVERERERERHKRINKWYVPLVSFYFCLKTQFYCPSNRSSVCISCNYEWNFRCFSVPTECLQFSSICPSVDKDRRHIYIYCFFSSPGPPLYRSFTITLIHTTLDRSPLDQWSARRRDLYLTTHTTNKRQTFMPQAGFEPSIPASEWPHTHALDRAATWLSTKQLKRTLHPVQKTLTMVSAPSHNTPVAPI